LMSLTRRGFDIGWGADGSAIATESTGSLSMAGSYPADSAWLCASADVVSKVVIRVMMKDVQSRK
jgi:hypothetical protein